MTIMKELKDVMNSILEKIMIHIKEEHYQINQNIKL